MYKNMDEPIMTTRILKQWILKKTRELQHQMEKEVSEFVV